MEKTFEENVRKYNPLMYSFINKTYVSGYEKEDLYQECLMVLHKSLHEFDESKGIKFMTYLYVNLRNKMYDLIKSQKELVLVDDQSTLIGSIMSHYDEDLEHDEFSDELEKDILSVLKNMPRGNITYLLIYGNMTQQEVADKLGISRQRVQYLHKRNIRELKELFLTIL